MHEVSLVAVLLAECERQAAGQPIAVVRVRHASTLPEEVLRQAFELLTTNGDLARARLETTPFDVRLDCGCGFAGPLDHDHVIGGTIVVCPACGAITTPPRTAELELLEVRTVS